MLDDSFFLSPWPILHFETLDSTNAHAIKLAETGERGPCWVHAERQTAGRGRLGRTWSSPKGNLYATALFKFPGSMREAPLVCFVAGLAVTDAINKQCPSSRNVAKLKWPNDVVVSDKKLAGILIETGSTKSRTWMAVGIGVNLGAKPHPLDRPTIALAELPDAPEVSPSEFLTILDATFRQRMTDLARNGFHAARLDWLERTIHTDRKVSYPHNGQLTHGDFLGLAEDGSLIVCAQDGQTHHVRAGDVGLVG